MKVMSLQMVLKYELLSLCKMYILNHFRVKCDQTGFIKQIKQNHSIPRSQKQAMFPAQSNNAASLNKHINH